MLQRPLRGQLTKTGDYTHVRGLVGREGVAPQDRGEDNGIRPS